MTSAYTLNLNLVLFPQQRTKAKLADTHWRWERKLDSNIIKCSGNTISTTISSLKICLICDDGTFYAIHIPDLSHSSFKRRCSSGAESNYSWHVQYVVVVFLFLDWDIINKIVQVVERREKHPNTVWAGWHVLKSLWGQCGNPDWCCGVKSLLTPLTINTIWSEHRPTG